MQSGVNAVLKELDEDIYLRKALRSALNSKLRLSSKRKHVLRSISDFFVSMCSLLVEWQTRGVLNQQLRWPCLIRLKFNCARWFPFYTCGHQLSDTDRARTFVQNHLHLTDNTRCRHLTYGASYHYAYNSTANRAPPLSQSIPRLETYSFICELTFSSYCLT